MLPKVVYVVSGVDKALAFEWVGIYLSKQYELFFIFLNSQEGETERYLKDNGIDCFRIVFRGKKDLPSAFLQVFNLLRKIKPDIVHTHLFEASLVGLLAARILRVPKRIYTRHHGTIHHLYFPRAVFYDKCINSLATHIVAISGGVKEILCKKEGVHPKKLRVIHHGFDLALFSDVEPVRVTQVKKRHNIPDKGELVIGVISRYTEWKGIQFVISAFLNLLNKYPKAHLILANARGDYAPQVKKMLKKLPQGSFTEISFETDVAALYHCFDIFLHVPVDPFCEAFGQTYVEALAAGVPSVFTLSGVAQEFIRNQHNAVVVPFQDSCSIEKAVNLLQASPQLRNKLQKNGQRDVEEGFALKKMVQNLMNLYNE